MQGQETTQETDRGGASQFADTHWSVVLAAKEEGSTQADEAMEKLCQSYWRPLYAYVRRQRHSPEEAEDLTQEFFVRLKDKNYLAHLKHQNGKFRSFLLTLLKHFLSDERDKARALKRGGGESPTPLDALSEEERYRVEPAEHFSPEHLFDRRWAQTVLERAAGRLRDEYAATGKIDLFDALHHLQPGQVGPAPSYAELGARLSLSESAVTSAVFRLRRRQAELLREEVAQTVRCREDVDEEIRYLIEVLGRSGGLS